ncbi:helix-turn-helix domain-containing protein [Natribacillus halophilus]|uniref:Protein RodZ, contains Xre-like HTH and DUF4115 domains n=1 Tax=Natribacillus halophilus TaxID=549003 RepID=A0A1G8PRW9_9BACI|nr:helix-turn-helix domain-containing protein [Natribacillus halophilus]SDI95213.1 protein RodZ, contains Xre-like HTH and DUF4115 domains [Natribacillus halophilus]
MGELGQFLQAQREEKGWGLDEVQARTKIQKRYLLAIEEGRYDDLPGAFYARAFIKSYAEALDLEPEEVFAEYEHDLPKPRKESVELPTRAERSNKRASQENEKKNPVLPAILVVAFLVAIVGVIWLMNIDTGGDIASEEEEGDMDIIDEPAAEDDNENTEEEGNGDEDAENAEENNETNGTDTNGDNDNGSLTFEEVTDGFNSVYTTDSDSLDVTLEFDEDTDSYVDFREEPTDDGSIVETAAAPSEASEQEYDFSEYDEITINAGYTPALTIYVNGEELEYELDPNERDFQRITIQRDE